MRVLPLNRARQYALRGLYSSGYVSTHSSATGVVDAYCRPRILLHTVAGAIAADGRVYGVGSVLGSKPIHAEGVSFTPCGDHVFHVRNI